MTIYNLSSSHNVTHKICLQQQMSDPSSTFIIAAFVAGVIEGSSIFQHYCNLPSSSDDTSSSINTPNITAHSILYGAVSLPLGIIGASPGLAFYPKGLQGLIDAEVSSHDVHSSENDSLATASAGSIVSRGVELRETPVPTSTNSPIISGTGRGIGRLLRHENLKKNMPLSNSEPSFVGAGQTAAPRSKTSAPKTSQLSRYISTLDGRALPTPLSEAMKRSRGVLVGASLVSFAVTQYLSSSDWKDKTVESNGGVSYGSIIDEHGKVDYMHGYELQRRLRADMALAASKPDALVSDKLSFIWHNSKPFSKKAQQIALNGLCSSIELMQHQLGRNLDILPINWLFQWRDNVSADLKEYMDRPIAIRLVLSDVHNMPSVLTNSYPPFLWPTQNQAQNNDKKNGSSQQHNPFFILPVHFSGSWLAFNQMNNPLTQPGQISPWWEMDSVAKPLKDLPINSSWLFNLHHRQGPVGEATQSESVTQSTNASSSGTLIIEANISPPVYDILQQRYPGKNSTSNFRVSSGSVAACCRMLQSLTQTKGLNSVANPSASTVLIHSENKVDLKEQVAKSWNAVVYFDAFDVFKQALVSAINNISLELEPIDDTTQADNTDEGDAYAAESTQSTKGSSNSTSEISSDSKHKTTPWTFIDVLGTSIRHLLESTYSIVSAVTYLGRHTVPEASTSTNSIPKIIHFVSDCNSSWLKESIVPFGWKVRHHQPNTAKHYNISSGVVLILGRNDVETCELTYSLIENSHIQKNPRTKLLVVLEHSSMLEMLYNVTNQIEHSQEDITNSTAVSRLKYHPAEELLIMCPSFVYEYAFAVARSLLANGANTAEVQFEVERRLSQ